MTKQLVVHLLDMNAKTRAVTTVSPNDSVIQVSYLMKKHKIGLMVVLDGDRMVGVASERDIVQRWICGSNFPKDIPIKDIMTKGVEYVTTLDTMYDCYLRFVARNCRHLPVLDPTGRVIAVLSLCDVTSYVINQLTTNSIPELPTVKSKKKSAAMKKGGGRGRRIS